MNPGIQTSAQARDRALSKKSTGGLYRLKKQSQQPYSVGTKKMTTRLFSAKDAILFLIGLFSNLWSKLTRTDSSLKNAQPVLVAEPERLDCRFVKKRHRLRVSPAEPIPQCNILTKEYPEALAESDFTMDMVAVALVPAVAGISLLALEAFGVSTVITPKYDWTLAYSLAALPVVFWTGIIIFAIGMKFVLSKEDFKDQVVKCNNAYHHIVTALAYTCFLALNVIYFQYFWFGWTLSAIVWLSTAVKDWNSNFKNQPGAHNEDFDGHKEMPELAVIDGVKDLPANFNETEAMKAGKQAENWSMATKYIPLYLFIFLRIFLVPNVWINVISRIFLHHFNTKFLYEFDYDEDYYSKLCCEWILETCVGVYIKSVDTEAETATWFMHNVCLSEFSSPKDKTGHMKVYPGMSIKLDLANKRVISSELRDVDSTVTNISNQDLSQILIWLLFTRVHHKIHAGSVWNLDFESDSIARRIQSATSVFYNYLGWNNPAFMSGLSGNQMLNILESQNAVGPTFLTNMFSKMTYHKELKKLRKYSKMVEFLVSLRNELKAPCVETNSKSKSHGEGVFLSAMHAIDHHTLNKVVPTDACFGNHWKWKGIADHNRAVFVMQTDDNPMVVYPHKYSSPWATERQRHIYKMAYKINPEFADELETCVIR